MGLASSMCVLLAGTGLLADSPGDAERFLVQGSRKAHVLVRVARDARVLMAFPAGNVAAALWFESCQPGVAPALELESASIVEAEQRAQSDLSLGHRRQPLWGARIGLTAPPRPILLTRALLHNLRTVRGYVEGYPDADSAVVQRLIGRLRRFPAPVQRELADVDITDETLRRWLVMTPEVIQPRAGAPTMLRLFRPTLGGKGIVDLSIQIEGGSAHATLRGILIRPTGEQAMRLCITALHPYTPPETIAAADLLSARGKAIVDRLATSNPARFREVTRAIEGISFLSSREAFLAGSFRFLTYFGRDTLVFLMLMGPYLSATAWTSGMQSVLDRLAEDGTAAHEEDVEEHGALDHLARLIDLWPRSRQAARRELDALVSGQLSCLDDKMVDTTAMVPLALAAMVHHYPGAAQTLVESHREPIERALRAVLRSARGPMHARKTGRAFPAGLVRLKNGYRVGDWRDSELGLGGGVYPASVNACLMPAAIDAIAELLAGHIVSARALGTDGAEMATLRHEWARVFERFVVTPVGPWTANQTALFEGALARSDARSDARPEVGPHARPDPRPDIPPAVAPHAMGVTDPAPTSAATPAAAPTSSRARALTGVAILADVAVARPRRFLALALDERGKPVRVMHGDGLLLLLDPERPHVDLETALAPILTEFPAGLSTAVGPLVASAAGDPARIEDFQPFHYHGMVVWSWPMVLARLGVERLREWGRPELAARLERVAVTWGPPRVEPEELWSIARREGRMVRAPFGRGARDVTESNTLQLWSLASLAAVLQDAEQAIR